MRSGLVQLGAWTAATGAAVALSWLGVHAVLVDTVFEQPVAVALPSVASSRTEPVAPPPNESPSAAPATSAAPSPSPDPDPAPGTTAPAKSTTAARRSPTPAGTVHSYLLPGGRVALDLQPTEAKLISATPEVGWKVQTWQGDKWLRINFSKDDRVSQMWVTWNGTEPTVQTEPG
ncbi:hypothetical protein [Streptomyces sp. TLI_171]|uniref:hypothetical protein n=1 Tax=Streptomyces sp. TLI_171 TaxID=1938859 RepID=UPI000C4051AE|nr:hypothetical protein [Streptomyces sp. TLI_171]RKE19270.1 hypothetical protein BX266_2586 [Streptomyces sp. TLI_171]